MQGSTLLARGARVQLLGFFNLFFLDLIRLAFFAIPVLLSVHVNGSELYFPLNTFLQLEPLSYIPLKEVTSLERDTYFAHSFSYLYLYSFSYEHSFILIQLAAY